MQRLLLGTLGGHIVKHPDSALCRIGRVDRRGRHHTGQQRPVTVLELVFTPINAAAGQHWAGEFAKLPVCLFVRKDAETWLAHPIGHRFAKQLREHTVAAHDDAVARQRHAQRGMLEHGTHFIR